MSSSRRIWFMKHQWENPMKVKPPRHIVLGKLQKGIVNLQFEKKDGSIRDMRATLLSAAIPDEFIAESNPNARSEDPDLVRCFDVDVNGWRSFKISALREFNS